MSSPSDSVDLQPASTEAAGDGDGLADDPQALDGGDAQRLIEEHGTERGQGIASAAGLVPPPLPVIDLIGLRFSLQHLRLVGYGLLLVWLSELMSLVTSPAVGAIATRLHYISQFLDLSPILLVAIGLIAFQGGLRRGAWEVVLLPLLLTLLPLLSAFHLFLAPISVANAVTLVQKQEQIGRDQIRQIDSQINRANSILRESDSIDGLLQDLKRIPGLEVRVPPEASVTTARQQVRRSLERESDRLRTRINSNTSDSRATFLRRASINALLALFMGLSLWGLHRGALREMELSIPFLDWVLVQGEVNQQPEALQDLLRFQRACVALGWFALLEGGVRLVRQVGLPRARGKSRAEKPRQQPARLAPPPNPFQHPVRRRSRPRSAPPPSFLSFLVPSALPWQIGIPMATGIGDADGDDPRAERAKDSDAAGRADDAPAPRDVPPGTNPPHDEGTRTVPFLPAAIRRIQESQQQRDLRRRQKDLERYRRHRRRLEREGRDLDPWLGDGPLPGPEGQDRENGVMAPSPAGTRNLRSHLPAFPGAGWGSRGASPSDENPDGLSDASADLSPAPMSEAEMRRLQRDHARAREALQRMADSEEMRQLFDDPEAPPWERLEADAAATGQRPGPLTPEGPHRRRRGLAGWRFWFRPRP